MIREFIKRLMSVCARKRKERELSPAARDVFGLFREIVLQYSKSDHVPWFGQQVLRYMDEHPDSAVFENGELRLDVSVTALEPGDWGDEIFNVMYCTEKNLQWHVIKRDMSLVPDDWDQPEAMRSREQFVAIRWKLSKEITEGR